jgi:hypothetical protein
MVWWPGNLALAFDFAAAAWLEVAISHGIEDVA